jgi:hypothetical protein
LYSGENRRLVCLVITSLQIGRYFTDRSGIREQRQLSDRRLYAFEAPARYGALAPLFGQRLNRELNRPGFAGGSFL